MRRVCGLLPLALCLLMAGPVAQGGTFTVVATGVVSAKLTGQSSYRVSSDGQLVIVLITSTPSRVAIVIAGEAGNLPAAETVFALVSESCDNDAPTAADVERTGGFSVTVRGGSLSAPDWAASAQAGTLTISRSAKGITGRMDLSACGEHVQSGERVELKLVGTFEAGGPR